MTCTPSDASPPADPGTYNRLYARQVELLARLAAVQRVVLDQAQDQDVRGVTDRKDDAERAERELLDEAQAVRDHAELVAVRAAIARLQDCTYGVCIACGEQIDPLRLQARPEAVRCTACQHAYEALAVRSQANE
jgi:DnaK suppressor protein